MYCLIIDDCVASRRGLEQILSQLKDVAAVFTAIHSYEIRTALSARKYGVVFIRPGLWDFRLFESLSNLPLFVFLLSGSDKMGENIPREAGPVLKEPYHAL